MARRRRKRDDDNENLERWLLTYADLITLLLAFFIMMYTFSKQDSQKYAEVVSHLRSIFSGEGVPTGTGELVGIDPAQLPSKMLITPEEIKRQLEEDLKGITDLNGSGENITVISDERGIVIRILDKAFFDEGKAELKERARNTLTGILPTLKNVSNQVRIEGHTDNVPINTVEFKSNWELSVRRATEVVRYYIEKGNLSPARVSAAGYAEYRPVMSNNTPHNRAMNRRIEIIILKSNLPDL